mgnify:CR=1 FL=1
MLEMGYDIEMNKRANLIAGYIFHEQDILSINMKITLPIINSFIQDNEKVIFDEKEEPTFEALSELIEF